MCGLNIKKILVPLDGSNNSFRGLDRAIYLARQCHATITGLYVVGIVQPGKNAPVSTIEKYLLENAAKFMRKAKVRAAKNGVLFYDKVMYGDEGRRIVSYAKNNSFDMIVIGARGRSLAKEIFLGSTSNYVLHKSPVPVLIIK
jgi:nucleotide-binding universal stress UspA family protein